MLNAKELRVGNYLYCKEISQFPIKVNTIWSDPIEKGNYIIHFDWEGEDEQTGADLSNCEPIPLTEDWLLKFGFEEWHEHYFVLHNVIDGTSNFEVTLENGKAYPSIDDTCIYWRKNCYVHDLQNLLFALTGYELEI